MVIAIIQARMGSTRLPNKSLMDLDGKTALEFMIDRVRKSDLIDDIVIATTIKQEDDVIADLCINNQINCYRGSENDVLDRYYKAAVKYKGDLIIRLTSDCPLIDPKIIDSTIELYQKNDVHYTSNTVPQDKKKFPDGTDVEVFSFDSLKTAWENSTDIKDREHVTFYFTKNKNKFKTLMLDNSENWGDYRITIDYPEDIELVRNIILRLNKENKFGYVNEIIQILESNPDLIKINSMHSWGANW